MVSKHSCRDASSAPSSPSAAGAPALRSAASLVCTTSPSEARELDGARRANSEQQPANVSLYCTPSEATPASKDATAGTRVPASSSLRTPLLAKDTTKETTFSRVLDSSSRLSSSTRSVKPPSDLSRASSWASRCRTSATKARKAFDLSSEPMGDSRVSCKKSCMPPRFTPASWMLGLLEKRSARSSKVRGLMEPPWERERSSNVWTPSSFSMLRATSGSSQRRSMTSNAVQMLASVLSSARICPRASNTTLFGSSIWPKASSMAFSKNSLSSSVIFLNCEGAVPSWYLVLQASRPGQLSAIVQGNNAARLRSCWPDRTLM
mmetsp:Transcript_119704/g.298541  ORF Transcript_119704/g.298541 Transcript_119704/m.298541 type:complete len:321 (+) Transcript_119704:279-1241(+)